MADTPITPPLVSMAQQFTGLPMEDLIGAPLRAAANANSMMALTQTRFLLDTCFIKIEDKADKTKFTYSPILIKMTLTRAVIQPQDPADDGKIPPPKVVNVSTTFDLPLLTILPLNSLAVETADVEFDMEVKSSYSEDSSEKTQKDLAAQASWDAKVNYGIFSVEVKGSVSYKSSSTTAHSTHYQKSNSASYTVKVHAGQLPLPQGVNTIIQAFTNSISPIEMPIPTTPPKP